MRWMIWSIGFWWGVLGMELDPERRVGLRIHWLAWKSYRLAPSWQMGRWRR